MGQKILIKIKNFGSNTVGPFLGYLGRNLRYARLTLTLFETGILLVDDIQLPLPPHDLTIGAALFD